MTTPAREQIPEVGDGEDLIRHLDPRFHWDFKEGRPNVGAFKSGEVSFDREAMRAVDVAKSLRAPEFGFARLAVAIPRHELGLRVEKDPFVPNEPLLIEPEPSLAYNPAHAVVRDARRASHAKRMRDAATVLQTCSAAG